MDTLRQTSKQGDLVFADDWDVFPVLFYYNHHNYYMFGLDPIYSKQAFPPEYWRFDAIARGRTPSTINAKSGLSGSKVRLEDIRDHLAAKYVVIMDDHKKMFQNVQKKNELFKMIHPELDGQPRHQPPASLFKVILASQD